MMNMDIYNAGRAVPPEAQKAFDNGKFAGTDINPMWRIKRMTELFGPCGIGWYYEILSERYEEHGPDNTIAIVDLNLYIKVDGEWSKPIYGTGGNVIKRVIRKPGKDDRVDVSDEGYKMALTDALSVACKALGIGADIYFSKDRTKYTAAQETAQYAAPTANLAGDKLYYCDECGMQLGDVIGKDGKTVTVQKQLELLGKYGIKKVLCPGCFKKAMGTKEG